MKAVRLDGAKRVCINILVDGASIILAVAASAYVSNGLYTIYSSYYQTNSLPPDIFQAASLQFATAIGFVFMAFTTRKYRKPEPKQPEDIKKP